MAGQTEAQCGRFSWRCDEKRGNGSELRNDVVKNFVGKKSSD